MNFFFKSRLIVLALLGTLVLGACTSEETIVHPQESPALQTEQTSVQLSTTPEVEKNRDEYSAKVEIMTALQQDGSLKLSMDLGGSFYLYDVKSSIEMSDQIYQYLHGSSSYLTGTLVSIDPQGGSAELISTQTVAGSGYPGFSFFLHNSGILGKLDETSFLFLDPEVTDEGVKVHLSAFHTDTGELERLHSDIWRGMEQSDTIYQHQWNEKTSMLFLQSFEGTIWLFDLTLGEYKRLDNKFRVIPHSTTGYPSLFVSPAMDRFAFDDESGVLTFYDMNGEAKGKYLLKEGRYVPSEKVKWNPSGTIAWIEMAVADDSRTKAVDIDYLSIAAERIDFLDKNGKVIRTLHAPKDRSIEIIGWLENGAAVVKEYEFRASEEERETNIRYYSYAVSNGRKSAASANKSTGLMSFPENRYDYELKENAIYYRLKS
ncbi:hypothetical protein [Paenibacillus paeoniae]|uniref:WD40 repeat domain-containing protein n=1 Tax=Paenibacillus paeoniae TaxID=2292705 RepID=A0A371PIR5_9BACL|nr:hypothetical protein [Paenibacillus paeoniae]REK76130.1 hypothetical protein DX130_03440 [Paenibacillus paeoniae]